MHLTVAGVLFSKSHTPKTIVLCNGNKFHHLKLLEQAHKVGAIWYNHNGPNAGCYDGTVLAVKDAIHEHR